METHAAQPSPQVTGVPATGDRAAGHVSALPAVKYDAHGNRHVDYRAIAALAGPLFLSSLLVALLFLTDTWFIGRLSVDAVAAMGATFYLVFVFEMLIGSVGLCVQTLAAQNFGAGRLSDAAKSVWTGLYAVLAITPLFIAAALLGEAILAPFQLAPNVEKLAIEYWFPRLIGAPFQVTFWAISGFFNGIGRTRVTLMVSAGMLIINAALNEVLIFRLGMGIAGSAWATTISHLAGTLVMVWLFLHPLMQEKFQSRIGWRLDIRALKKLFVLALPIGLLSTVNVVGYALFQLMQAQLSPIAGAATQIVSMMTSLAFEPGLGLALAATTLVGQSIGAGDKDWAMRVGTATTVLVVAYMGVMGVLLALAGPWLAPLFINASDPNAAAVIKLSTVILWIASAYQVFDGLYTGSALCLRGAGDAKAPAIAAAFLSWLGFVPLAHMLSFRPGEGWGNYFPQLGFGAEGGWVATVIYICLLGLLIFWRWRSGAWRRIDVIC